MSRRGNELKATSWKRVDGKPLGNEELEYRNLYIGDQCIACYVYSKISTDILSQYQAELRDLE